ncbi:hypothetical protein NESM_000691500 [Novymonas esmeraldas]|uniref:Uncharacterized protein n=1 Tax=Novymonas esmeraldas TaxID=1808958 RepID=A0AAW0EUH7_9TRYP
MTSSMLALGTTAQRAQMLECGPCALLYAMRQRGSPGWTLALADFAVDMVAGALTLAGATEVLVPASLVHFIESSRHQSEPWPWPAWDAALAAQRLVSLVSAQDVARFVRGSSSSSSSSSGGGYGRAYNSLCIPVPAGPLVAQLDFGMPVEVFYGDRLPAVLDVVGGETRLRWRAWVRSALTCAYEGSHVPPIRVAEYTSQLLRQSGGCESVIWEAAVAGLTPRWLETAAKTALAVGVPPASVTLALPEEPGRTPHLLAKSVEVGIAAWASCAIADGAMYPHAAAAASPHSVQCFIVGWNEVSATARTSTLAADVDGDEAAAAADSVARCEDYVVAVSERAAALLPLVRN